MAKICTILNCNTLFEDSDALLEHKLKTHICGYDGCHMQFQDTVSRNEHMNVIHKKTSKLLSKIHLLYILCIIFLTFPLLRLRTHNL